MIPKAYITEWRKNAPWISDFQVEQDLIISRALVDMFSLEEITNSLAFRGGTALYKLYLHPAARYSEDIDLVQIRPEPIGETLDKVRLVLDPWLGTPIRKLKEGRVNLVYRFDSEDASPQKMRLKIEINSREHFNELGLKNMPFKVDSKWFSGKADIKTFDINELLGTKLRALYQRKKGRDLFDLWYAIDQGAVDVGNLIRCFDRYMSEGNFAISRAQFEANLDGKALNSNFRNDIEQLLHPDIKWDFDLAFKTVRSKIIEFLPGEPWQGA